MGFKERKKIIEKIEKIRGTKVITYIVSTRPRINTMIEPTDLRIFFNHLNDLIISVNLIDLYIYSNGGVSTVAWPLVNLLREFSNKISVLVPSNAFSCATSIASGADEIVMGRMGTLGPIDPTVANPFNPIVNNQLVGISVEDMSGYLGLIKDKFGIMESDNIIQAFQKLATDVRPLALGNAYRHYLKCRDDEKKLLELHLNPKKDKEKINKIISILVEKLYFHGHHINRKEAKSIGLNIIDADKISPELETLMWDLFIDYESEMNLTKPYVDELPAKGTKKELPIKFIESASLSSVKIIEQTWVDTKFPEGSSLMVANNQAAVFIPPNQVVPALFRGQPLLMEGKIFDKQETDYWKESPFINKKTSI